MARKNAKIDDGAEQLLKAPQKAVVIAVDDDSDRPDWAGGKGGPPDKGQGGGKPDNAGTKKGDLYGDQYVLLRDLDPDNDPFDDDGGGNGEPELDANDNPILVGSNEEPIFYVDIDPTEEEEWEIPAADLPFVQEVELGRANVARAPDKVMEKALGEALGKIDGALVTTDAAGRIVCDGVKIDSPVENLALYQFLMTAGGHSSWPAVTDHWPEELTNLLGDDLNKPDWDPSSLLGAAWAKDGEITLDAMLYENTALGINTVDQDSGTVEIDYFDFCDGDGESFDYVRSERYGSIEIQWYEDTDGDGDLDLVPQTSVYNAVFGGVEWVDEYAPFGTPEPEGSGVNDFAQAADDARAVIYFMHEHYGAIEVPAADAEPLIG